jgi:hypothetical protein
VASGEPFENISHVSRAGMEEREAFGEKSEKQIPHAVRKKRERVRDDRCGLKRSIRQALWAKPSLPGGMVGLSSRGIPLRRSIRRLRSTRGANFPAFAGANGKRQRRLAPLGMTVGRVLSVGR